MKLQLALPMRTRNPLNGSQGVTRGAMMGMARQRKSQRTTVYVTLLASKVPRPELPCVVTLTRIAPRRLDDDGLTAALKSCRDGVADWLRVDDRDERVTWEYRQARGGVREYAVIIGVRRE